MMQSTDTRPERALLVGIVLPRQERWEVDENLQELQQLALTAGVEVVDVVIQDRNRIDPAYFIGSGKVEEVARLVKALQIDSLIFDDDLSPAQVRNLENSTGAKIVDRSTLILDIFAKHARTREAKTQVELAQLEHLLPRLTRQWSHLSRQVGGIGTKGPGETQLETDRRLIRKRIEVLRKELKKIDQQRTIRRQHREGIFKAALIGYTNVGKSTLMNLLSGANIRVENQLFATLDSTVRKVWLDSDHQILLSDTVGFIRKLPHQLVASFKSTLDEVRDADLLLHVVDISHPNFKEQMHTVMEVLEEIGVHDKPIVTVFNKIDLLQEKTILPQIKQQYPVSVFISAVRQIQIDRLKRAIIDFIEQHFVDDQVSIPVHMGNLIHMVHELAVVTEEDYRDSLVILNFRSTIPNRARIIQMVKEQVRQYKQQRIT